MKADGVGSDAKTRKPDDAGVPTYPAQYRARRLGTEKRSTRTVTNCILSFLDYGLYISTTFLEYEKCGSLPDERRYKCQQFQSERTV